MWEVKTKSDLNSSTFDLLLTYNLCHVNPCSGMSQCQVGSPTKVTDASAKKAKKTKVTEVYNRPLQKYHSTP